MFQLITVNLKFKTVSCACVSVFLMFSFHMVRQFRHFFSCYLLSGSVLFVFCRLVIDIVVFVNIVSEFLSYKNL